MKKALLCGVAALALLLAVQIAPGKEGKKTRTREAKQKLSDEQKAWQAKLKAMTPEQRRIALATKALETELAPWKQVRAIAVEEKAAKTVAAIDKVIAAKEAQMKKKQEAMKKRSAGDKKRPAGDKNNPEGQKKTRPEGKRKAGKKAEAK